MNRRKGFNSVGITMLILCIALGAAAAKLWNMPLFAIAGALMGLWRQGSARTGVFQKLLSFGGIIVTYC